MFEAGYINYVVGLFLLSSVVVLFIDVKIYERDKLKKEGKAARFLGWVNMALGVLVFLVNWGYYAWFF